jgi:hypothetical protein
MGEHVDALGTLGFVRITGPFARIQDAWAAARALIDAASADDGPLAMIGDFVLPPPGGPPSRDFQTLHLDFGIPLAPVVPADVARFTALHVGADVPPSRAVTRLVPLRPLLGGGTWPDHDELVRRFAAYGNSHGAWDVTAGYVEGSLARIVEAALGDTPILPSVRGESGFLCGTEFSSVAEEVEFFRRRGLAVEPVGTEVCLRPGELLVFDNLAIAHGRRGRRRPGELNQRIFGHQALMVDQLVELRERILAAFVPRDDPGRTT